MIFKYNHGLRINIAKNTNVPSFLECFPFSGNTKSNQRESIYWCSICL